jgi:hypothetical protein
LKEAVGPHIPLVKQVVFFRWLERKDATICTGCLGCNLFYCFEVQREWCFIFLAIEEKHEKERSNAQS